jgi:L-threonylcarbamoyladenylate synthase
MLQGLVVAIPTDTIYGLSCDASDIMAINKIYMLKERAREKPLPIFVANLEEAQSLAYFPDAALKLAHRFWPGPLTLVLKGKTESLLGETKRGIGHLCREDGTIAIRVSSSEIISSLLLLLKRPIITTSSNLAGTTPLDDPTKIAVVFGPALAAVLMRGKETAPASLPSTVVLCLEGKEVEVLREGVMTSGEIADALKS